MQAGNIPILSFFYLKSSYSKESLPFFAIFASIFEKRIFYFIILNILGIVNNLSMVKYLG